MPRPSASSDYGSPSPPQASSSARSPLISSAGEPAPTQPPWPLPPEPSPSSSPPTSASRPSPRSSPPPSSPRPLRPTSAPHQTTLCHFDRRRSAPQRRNLHLQAPRTPSPPRHPSSSSTRSTS